MKRFLGTAAGIAVLLLLSGCVPSVHPLYTEGDLIFDPALVGQWAEKDSKESWTYTKTGEKEYKLVYTDNDGKTGEFKTRLLKVEGRLFLDLFPESLPAAAQAKVNDFYWIHLVPAHTFMRVEQIGPTLRLAAYNPDWVKTYLKEHPDAVKHEMEGDIVLLTARPKDLQAFLITIEKMKGALGDPVTLNRKGAGEKK